MSLYVKQTYVAKLLTIKHYLLCVGTVQCNFIDYQIEIR